ncbi:hypothetical protein [Kangiella sp. TOML190]|uniref:hypothetical protein n=1 Tax=Kangiella sp. TOML190 TaxID=2931351 RepID=UPI002041CFE7|nr:hypothetical protein [Kangiella sp. TOML190]
MKLITSLAVISTLAVASFAADAGHRGGGKLIVHNDSKDATAVGGELVAAEGSYDWFGGSMSYLQMAGYRANAGSVVVNGCPCRKKTILKNKSRNALAIGAANAGSIVLNAHSY